jgi:hypothetical protein
MKYELSPDEKRKLNTGEILSHACYDANAAGLCEFIKKNQNVRCRFQESESPTGRKIYICYFYPTTFYQAYQIGSMLNRPELYQDFVAVTEWEVRFSTKTPVL